MQLTADIITVHTTHPFIIARGGQRDWQVVTVKLRDNDGVEGWGEAAPSRYYGETADSVVAALSAYAPVLEKADSWSLEAVEASLEQTLRGNASARCAVSAALHDLTFFTNEPGATCCCRLPAAHGRIMSLAPRCHLPIMPVA